MSSEKLQSPSVILRAEGLVKIYGKRRVVDGVSFYVNKGEIVGLLGQNGAGKTTSFRMVCGLISTNGGMVYLGSQEVTNWAMYRRSREGGMGYLPQEKSVFQKLSVQNNLLAVMEMLGMRRTERKRRCDELLEKFHLTHLRRNYGGSLSGGERRRLEIARSLVSDPKIILLDEPFAAVDPITVADIQGIIRQLSQEGIAILITDHSVQDTLQITHRSYVVQAGKILCHGTPEEVLMNPEARKNYFGENVSVEQIRQNAPAAYKPAEYIEDEMPKKRFLGQRHGGHHKEHSTEHNTEHKAHNPVVEDKDEFSDSQWDTIIPRRREMTPDPAALAADNSSKRLLGKRLTQSGITMPQRPVVGTAGEFVGKEEEKTSEDPSTGMSGILRSLSDKVFKKK